MSQKNTKQCVTVKAINQYNSDFWCFFYICHPRTNKRPWCGHNFIL